jgi:hypothetical protein
MTARGAFLQLRRAHAAGDAGDPERRLGSGRRETQGEAKNGRSDDGRASAHEKPSIRVDHLIRARDSATGFIGRLLTKH